MLDFIPLKFSKSKALLFFTCNLIFLNAFSQDSTFLKKINISGYLEAYYLYDFSKPADHERPDFLYNHKRHNELNLNLGYVQFDYKSNRTRANLTFMTGTYAQYNLSSEAQVFQYIYQANFGIQLSEKRNLWLDAGIMPSHIGFETAVSKDAPTLTRSILAENSPYYETGVKLSYISKNEQLYLALLYLNGWQRIQRIPANQTPAFGTQITYAFNKKVNFNWSTYVGNEQPDTLKKWRYFNNFYSGIQVSPKIKLVAGFDVGMEQKLKGSISYNSWYSPILIGTYSLSKKLNISGRIELYSDTKGVILQEAMSDIGSYSFNADYIPVENVLLRFEFRSMKSSEKIFNSEGQPDFSNYSIATALCFSF